MIVYFWNALLIIVHDTYIPFVRFVFLCVCVHDTHIYTYIDIFLKKIHIYVHILAKNNFASCWLVMQRQHEEQNEKKYEKPWKLLYI